MVVDGFNMIQLLYIDLIWGLYSTGFAIVIFALPIALRLRCGDSWVHVLTCSTYFASKYPDKMGDNGCICAACSGFLSSCLNKNSSCSKKMNHWFLFQAAPPAASWLGPFRIPQPWQVRWSHGHGLEVHFEQGARKPWSFVASKIDFWP